MLTDTYHRLPLTAITVQRDARQRKEVELDEGLLASIKQRGVIQPIVVEKRANGGYLLIAGERRLAHSREAGLPDIPVRFTDELTPLDRLLLEFEENAKRLDLPWKDRANAVWQIHTTHLHFNPAWTQTATADSIGMSDENVSVILYVAEALHQGNPTIQEAGGIRAAYNILARRQERVMGDALNTLLAPGKPAAAISPLVVTPPAAGSPSFSQVQLPTIPPVIPQSEEEASILNTSFLDWAPAYEGQPFNLLHCDFPYGIGLHESEQAKSANWDEKYDDSDETFWALCNCLTYCLDKLMSPSSHLLFWCPSDLLRQHEILEFFKAHAPSLTFTTVPYIWHKTDNRGILPDPKRGGRRVYETALLASRGDRFIVRAVSNAYGSPSSKEIHQSEKPEPMLRHYFQMLVDENTRLLDPTCGSASALRAAESLGADSVLGLEINKGYVEAARIALRRSRLKAAAAARAL